MKLSVKIGNALSLEKGYNISSRLARTAEAGAVETAPSIAPGSMLCGQARRQLVFIKSGGLLVESDCKKIRREIQDIFQKKLDGLACHLRCRGTGEP